MKRPNKRTKEWLVAGGTTLALAGGLFFFIEAKADEGVRHPAPAQEAPYTPANEATATTPATTGAASPTKTPPPLIKGEAERKVVADSASIIIAAGRCLTRGALGKTLRYVGDNEVSNHDSTAGKDGKRGTADDIPELRMSRNTATNTLTFSISTNEGKRRVQAVVNGHPSEQVFSKGPQTPETYYASGLANAVTPETVSRNDGGKGSALVSGEDTTTWNIRDTVTGETTPASRPELVDWRMDLIAQMSTMAVQTNTQRRC